MGEPDIHVYNPWPITLYLAEWPEHQAKAPAIIEHLYAIRSQHSANIASGVSPGSKSPSGLFESRFDLFSTSHPELTDLTEFIGVALKTIVSHVNGGATPPDQIDVVATESWFHITNSGGYHDAHQHQFCSWCGIYYLQAGDPQPEAPDGIARNGINRFYSPLATGGSYTDFGNDYLKNGNFDVQPEDGVLVLFPSFLQHSALPYTGEKDRIVVSFNSRANLSGGPTAAFGGSGY